MSEITSETTLQVSVFSPVQEISLGDDVEIDDDFSFEGYQVVRGEFFANKNEPAISFNNYQLYVNMACIKKLPETDYVQILVNKKENILAIRPCSEDDRDSFLWRSINRSNGKRQPKYITARIFTAMLFEHMGWDHENRYRLIGKLKIAKGVKLFVFDLNSFEVYAKTSIEGKTTGKSSRGILPSEWQGQFGMPVEEHDKSFEITTFKSFTVFNIKDKRVSAADETKEGN